MCPLSDDALLDWALSPRDADPSVERHLQSCASCRERSRAVLGEQDLLRQAFAPAPAKAPAAPLPSPVWPRIGIAALLLITVAVGALLARSAGAPAERRWRHAALAPIQSDLSLMAQRIAAARETLPEGGDGKSTAAYLELLSQEEGLYLSGMQHYLDEHSPLSDAQQQELRATVQGFYTVLWTRADLADAVLSFRAKVKSLLNEEQFGAFEEFSRQGREWQWRTGIALLMEDLSGELDLRFSEAEKVRRALESNYPRADLPVLQFDRCPTDPLVENPTLTRAVRNSLDASYQRKFDSYLGNAKVARDRALKIVSQRRAPR